MQRDARSVVLGLLQPLYEAEVIDNGWSVFLHRLSRAMESDASAIAILDVEHRPTEIFAVGAFSKQLFDEYAAYFAAIDPWPAAFAASGRPYGQHVCSHELIAPSEFAKTEYYTDLWKPHGDLFHTCGALIPIDKHSVANFAIPRSRDRGAYSADDVTVMNLLSPHVTTALSLRKQFTKLRSNALSLEMSLDRAIDALVLLDDAGKILYANQAGTTEITNGERITSRQGRLKAGKYADERALDLAVRDAGSIVKRRGISMPLSQMTNESEASERVSITCLPLTSRISEVSIGLPHARVLVVLSATAESALNIVSLLRALYGLTATEANLAANFVGGASVQEVADRLRVSVGTARVHLKHVFAKTSTCRQGQLIALIHRLTRTWR